MSRLFDTMRDLADELGVSMAELLGNTVIGTAVCLGLAIATALLTAGVRP